jgi:hypothetical protein
LVSPGTDDGDHFSEVRSRLLVNSDNDLAEATVVAMDDRRGQILRRSAMADANALDR